MGDGTAVKLSKRLVFRVGFVGALIAAVFYWFAETKFDAPTLVPADGVVREATRGPAGIDVDAITERAKARVAAVRDRERVDSKTGLILEAAAVDRLRQIRSCEKQDGASCAIDGFSQKDGVQSEGPSAYQDALAELTIGELAFLRALAEDDIKNGRESRVPIASLAKAYVQHRDDNVREQALKLAELLPIRDAEIAASVAVRAVQTTVSGPLAVQALRLMAQTRAADPRLVDRTVLEALQTGGWDVRDAVAAEILPFLTRENRKSFEQILASAPPRSKLALHLRLGLEEFDRMERL